MMIRLIMKLTLFSPIQECTIRGVVRSSSNVFDLVVQSRKRIKKEEEEEKWEEREEGKANG